MKEAIDESNTKKVVKDEKKRKKTESKEAEVCVPDADLTGVKDEKAENGDLAKKKRRKKKKKQEQTINKETEVCAPDADADLTGVKEEKAENNDLPKKKRKKKEQTINKISNESISPVDDEQPVGGENDGLEEGDMLSPEERRVLERKLKKIQGKEEKKKQEELKKSEENSEEEESKTNVPQTRALEYLTCWSEKQKEWKFQKGRQVWLLRHMYDREKVSDAHFTVLLLYLETIKGVARETTVQKAEALVRLGAQEGAEGEATESQIKAHRAKEVIQILS